MNKQLIENRVDKQRVLKEVRAGLKKRRELEDDLKSGFDEEWKKKFSKDWNHTTAVIKGV